MTEQDELLEQEIARARDMMVRTTSTARRRGWAMLLEKLIAARTPQRVREMEREQGLL